MLSAASPCDRVENGVAPGVRAISGWLKALPAGSAKPQFPPLGGTCLASRTGSLLVCWAAQTSCPSRKDLNEVGSSCRSAGLATARRSTPLPSLGANDRGGRRGRSVARTAASTFRVPDPHQPAPFRAREWLSRRARAILPILDPRLKPVTVGAAAGLLLFVLPNGLSPIVLVSAALLAGWLLPSEPMSAALLFLLPTVVVGGIRVLAGDNTPAAGAMALGLVITVLFVAIFTHVGAGMALRRRN